MSVKRTGVGIAVFLLCISFFLAPIMLKAKGPVKQNPLLLPAETGDITYAIDEFEGRNIQYLNLLEIVGWAFVNGEGAGGSRISIVLKSDRHAYVIDANRTPRRMDVVGHFQNRELEDSGFMAAIPEAFLEDGTYEVGILVKRDEKMALQYTGRAATKYKKTVFPFGFSSLTNISLPKEVENPTYSIDTLKGFTFNGVKLVSIEGWAFIKGEDSVGQKVSIVLKSEKDQYVFISTAQNRPDVTDYFGTADNDNSGFQVLFPRDVLKRGSYRIGLLIQKGARQVLLYTDKAIEKK